MDSKNDNAAQQHPLLEDGIGVNGTAVNGSIKPDKSGRARFQFRFWLNAINRDEFALGQHLEPLKKARKFETTVKQALMLFFELRDGNTHLLRQLFPGVVAQLVQQTRANDEFEQLIERAATNAIRREMAGLQTMSITSTPTAASIGTEIDTGMSAPPAFGLTDFDDLGFFDSSAPAPSTGDDSGALNFLASMKALTGGQ